jgi:ABC-type transport system substrate-binding protein
MRWTLAASALALAGCRDPYPSPAFTGAGALTPRRGGVLRFAYDADVNTADPALAQDTVAAIPTRLLFDTLVGYGPGSTAIVPDLAERWEVSEDGRRYTFHLRADARFSNGRALTADDVRYSLERLLDAHRIASPGAENYRLLEGFDDYRSGRARTLAGVQPVDPRTVVFRLAQRDPTFLHALAMRFAAPVPREVVEALGDARFGQEPVGTGPFVLVRWEKSTRMEFARNPYHHAAPAVHLDGVLFELSVPPHLQFMRFLAGDLDYLSNYGLATADWLWLRRNPAWLAQTHRAEVPLIGAFMMNTRMAPFDNVHVRRAAAASIDREAIARMRNGRIRAAGALYPSTIAGYRAHNPHAQRFDLALARREMALAGHPGGIEAPFDLWTTSGESASLLAQLIQADLRRVGLHARIRQAALSVYYAALGSPGEVPMAFDGWQMDFPDPSNFIEPNFHSRGIHPENSSNHAFYASPALDATLDAAHSERDPRRRVALYEQAEDIVLRDAPWAFVYTPVSVSVTQPYLRGWVPHPVWNDWVGDAWLDLPRRRAAVARARDLRALGPLAALHRPWEALP